ncbi:MAG: glycosyltransferase family A protein [Natronomonas sp.]|nr:glycosyltransferase family A protein [Natronomonas sp.]
MNIDVAIPTYGGSEVIEESLDHLRDSAAASPLSINRIVIDYRPDGDETDRRVRAWAADHGIETEIHTSERSLPESRQFLCERIETPWFLFLDDDVRVRETTLSRLANAIATDVGAVQVRKGRHETDRNGDWSKWRTVRATTFCTLLRTACVRDVVIPPEITQLEDEYLRQHVENEHEKLWTFHHGAMIDHDNQGRHQINFREGYLAAKYGLLPYDYVFNNVPYNILTLGHPWRHTKRALGFCWGHLQR